MERYAAVIRERARRLLGGGEVEVFIGYGRGSVPMLHRPILIRRPEQTGELHWDSHCGLNLCVYLTKRDGRIGIPATGCQARSIANHIVENQIRRDQLHILGIPCEGMIDSRAVRRAFGQREIRTVEDLGEEFAVRGGGAEERFRKRDFLQPNCRTCAHPNPVLYDELLGEPVAASERGGSFRDVEKIEAQDPDRRWGFFTRAIARCIRCYACRNVCPLCYCPTCFVDESDPQWMGKSTDPTDTLTFHLLRAYHCAGRCTDCGACERACPRGIPLRQFTRKLNKDAKELFGWEAGLTIDQRPALEVHRPEDRDDFIR
jgi:formate dehydrogenase (coenzyme F420) beta subunit